jgi:hypothetical protein
MSDDTDRLARAAFDGEPHRHPSGRTPEWDLQPEHVKDVFRRRVPKDADHA